jgi:excinuclease ABC subunit B
MYADSITGSMKAAMAETKRRRTKQLEYNKKLGITPKSIIKSIPEQVTTLDDIKNKSTSDLTRDSIDIEATMKKYAEDLDFERAIECRERLKRIQKEIEKKNEK